MVEELESRLSADLPEGIESIAREEEEENPMVMEADAESFKRIFKYFTEIDGVSDQIVSALESIDEISDNEIHDNFYANGILAHNGFC